MVALFSCLLSHTSTVGIFIQETQVVFTVEETTWGHGKAEAGVLGLIALHLATWAPQFSWSPWPLPMVQTWEPELGKAASSFWLKGAGQNAGAATSLPMAWSASLTWGGGQRALSSA